MSINPEEFKEENIEVDNTPQEPQSTIFVKHVYDDKKKTVKSGSKKRVISIVALVVVISIVVASIFLVNKFLPELEGVTSSLPLEQVNILLKPDGNVINSTDVEILSITNPAESFVLKSTITETDGKRKISSWNIEGIDASLTDVDAIDEFVTSAVIARANQSFEDKNLSKYGLDKPYATVKIGLRDFDDKTLYVGNKMPMGDAYYCMLEGDSKVYTVDTSNIENYFKSTVEMASKEVIAACKEGSSNGQYFSNNVLYKYDKITISGKFYPETVEIVLNSGITADNEPYKMLKPYERFVDQPAMGELLTVATNGLKAESVYCYNATAEEIEEFGFNNPLVEFSIKISDYAYTLKLGKAVDEEHYSAMVSGKNQIFYVLQSDFEYFSGKVTDLLSSLVVMHNIYEVESVDFKIDNKDYKFKLAHKPDPESSSGAKITTVTHNGKTTDTQSFKNIYSQVLGFVVQEYIYDGATDKQIMQITFNLLDGKTRDVKIYALTDRRYIAVTDGVPIGVVLKANVDRVIDYVERYSNGEIIDISW